MRYFISAGEASGDLHASRLIKSIKDRDPQARFSFLGGDLMADAAGCNPAIHYRDMAYMGFSEVLRNLGTIRRNMQVASGLIHRIQPDAVILVDYPSFNLRLAREAYQLGIPVYYYISPKVWAWKEYRVKDIRRYTRRVLSILPFEVPFYRRHGMEIDYVGNPSVEEIDRKLANLIPDEQFRHTHSLPDKPIIALLPGSRKGEIRNNLPVMLDAVKPLLPKYQAVIAGAPAMDRNIYETLAGNTPVVYDASFDLLAHASAALVTSGTATLEAALTGTPQVVCYRANGSRISYTLMRGLLHVNYVSLPNLIADDAIVPEMLLHHCTPVNVLSRLIDILPGHPGRDAQLQGYSRMREILGTSNAPDRAAELITGDLNQ